MTRDPLVLLPGLMCDVRIWGPQIEALSLAGTLHLPHWGDGDSVQSLAEAVLAQAPPEFALAGMSLGGMVAMEILRQAPERVTRIALIGTNCLAETPPLAAERELRIVRAKAGRLATVMAEEVPATVLADGPLRAPISDFLIEMALDLGESTYLRQSRAMQRRPDQQRTLRQARLPALILCGAEDKLYLPRRHEFIAGLMLHADLRMIDGAGHVPTLEQPAEVISALGDWLERERKPLSRK